MSWRPKGWVNQRNRYLNQNQPPPPYYKTRQKDYEAGADAILKELKREAVYINYTGQETTSEPSVFSLVVPNKKGWLVLIEEDNENKD